jgi:hypothetical protein
MAEANQARGGQGVLVVYGEPPSMELLDSAGRKLGRFALGSENRASFETALRRALAEFLGGHAGVSAARFVFIRNAAEFAASIRSGSFGHVIYYGHALVGTNTLLPSIGHSITPWQLFNSLKGSTVRHFDILGCSSASIAAQLATDLPALRVGNLRAAREDNIEVNPTTKQVVRLKIDPQPVYHFGGSPK